MDNILLRLMMLSQFWSAIWRDRAFAAELFMGWWPVSRGE